MSHLTVKKPKTWANLLQPINYNKTKGHAEESVYSEKWFLYSGATWKQRAAHSTMTEILSNCNATEKLLDCNAAEL